MAEMTLTPSVKGPFDLPCTCYADFVAQAELAIRSGIVPKALAQIHKVLVVWQLGADLGMNKLMALRSIYVVNCIPSVYGDAVQALCRAKGVFGSQKDWYIVKGKDYSATEVSRMSLAPDDDDWVACCEVMRKGESDPMVGTFSVDDARTALLWQKKGKSGEPTPWCLYPKRQLMWRARGFAFRDKFADALGGLILKEEAEDYPEEDAKPIPSQGGQSWAQESGMAAIVNAFSRLKEPVSPEQLERLIGKPSNHWYAGELARLRKIFADLRDEKTTLDRLLNPESDPAPKTEGDPGPLDALIKRAEDLCLGMPESRALEIMKSHNHDTGFEGLREIADPVLLSGIIESLENAKS